jgi:menaquinone-dependent protoporphyrinogen IX oxidase
MNKKILVTYASRTGSTAQIAEAICKTLTRNGEKTELLPMQDVKDLSLYQAVITSSPIRKSRWLPEAMQFLQTTKRSGRAQCCRLVQPIDVDGKKDNQSESNQLMDVEQNDSAINRKGGSTGRKVQHLQTEVEECS